MTPKVFIGLALATLITTVAAIVVALGQPTATPARYVDEPAFPALRANPDAVAKVTLTTPEGSFTLVRASADRWVTPERADYPVAASQVRDLIVALADMRLIEPKTTRADRYVRLEVEDVGGEDGKSRLIRLENADGETLAEAIVGKQRQRLTGSQSAGTYIRRPDEAQSWLASGGVQLEPAVTDWLETELVDLQGDRVRRIEVRPPSGPDYAVVRAGEGQELRLDNLQEGEVAEEDAELGRLANALSGVQLEDVKPRDQLDWPNEHATAEVTTFDGLRLTVRLGKIGEEHWAVFDASKAEPTAEDDTTDDAQSREQAPATAEQQSPATTSGSAAIAAEARAGSDEAGAADPTAAEAGQTAEPTLTAQALNERLAPWAYRIPEHLYNRLTTARSEWLADKDGTS